MVNKDSKFNQIKVEECGSKRFLRTRDTQGPLKKRRLNGYVFNQINKPVQLKRLMYNENELSKSQNEQSDILQTSMDSYSINECKSTNKTLSTCVKLTTKIKYNKHYILFRDLLRTFKNSTVIDQHVNNKESEMINSTIQFPESATFTFYPRNVVKKKEKSVRFDIGSDIYDIKNVSEELKKIEHALAPQRSVSFSSKVVVHEVENVSEELQNIRYVNITMLVTKYLADIYPFDPETDTTGNPKGLGTIRDFISWCPDYFDGKLRYYNEDHSTQNSESQTKLDMSTPIFRDPIFWSSDPNYGQNKMKISRPIIPASFISEYTANDSNYSFNENIYVPSISVSTNNGSVNESNDFPNQSSSTPNSSSESSNKNVSSNEGSQLRRQPHNFERGRILDYKPNCPVTAEVNYFRMKYGRVTYPLFKW